MRRTDPASGRFQGSVKARAAEQDARTKETMQRQEKGRNRGRGQQLETREGKNGPMRRGVWGRERLYVFVFTAHDQSQVSPLTNRLLHVAPKSRLSTS